MTQLTTPRRFVLSAVLGLGACFEEDFGPYLPYTTSTGSSSDTGSGTADTSTGSTGDSEPVRACAAPEDVPPSLDLRVELDPSAVSCPNTFCVKGYSCGTCCDGEMGSSGTVSCCEQGSSYNAPGTGGGCEAPAISASCVKSFAFWPGPSRQTPTSCYWPLAPTCPPGYHIDAPSYVCNACQETGQSCPSGGSCQMYCGGQFGHD